MPRWAIAVGLLTGALSSVLSPTHCSAEPATHQEQAVQPAAPDAAKSESSLSKAEVERINALIASLGDQSFAARQRASKQLIEIGIVGQELLTAALASDDAEIRNRASQVLTQVLEADFRARLEAFANDPAGRGQHALPSWSRFHAVFGEGKAARALFVDMQRAEPGLLEVLEESDKLAGEMLMIRMQAILQAIQWPQANGIAPPSASLGTVCALLFVSSSEGVAIGDHDAIQLFNLIQQPSFQGNLRGTTNSEVLRKLLGSWILHNSGSAIAYQNLMLAFTYDLKEGLDLAIKMIGNEGGGQPFMRQYVILAIGRFGNHEHIPLIEPLLKDTTPCMPQNNNDPAQSQIRDVALAVLIKLSGQELKDYGLGHVQSNPQMVFQPGTISFGGAAKRETALKRWQQWAQRHPEPMTTEPKNTKLKNSEPSNAGSSNADPRNSGPTNTDPEETDSSETDSTKTQSND